MKSNVEKLVVRVVMTSFVIAGVALAIACSDTNNDDAECCPPSEKPNCCMSYGGRSVTGVCGEVCDGMPWPSDPGWKLVTDAHGCRVWTNPNDDYHGGVRNPETRYCGSPPPETGRCCQPSEAPSCCMDYGGWTNSDTCRFSVCDGMPSPSDPGWSLATDDHGCAVWTNPNDHFRGGIDNPATRYCGRPASSDAGSDADAD